MSAARVLFLLLCAVCLASAVSCKYSPEDMIEDYNGKFSSSSGSGESAGLEYTLDTLLEKGTYNVLPGRQLDFEVSSGYIEYTWTLTGSDGTSYDMKTHTWVAHINTNELNMAEGTYTLKLRVKNRLGIYYSDSARVIVGNY